MAFGINTFAETPFAAIVENPIVQVTGQSLTVDLGNESTVGNANVSVTGISLSSTIGQVGIFSGVEVPVTGISSTISVGTVSTSANANIELFNGTGPKFSASGNAALSTDQAKFGASSLELDGTDDFVDSTSNINLSSTDFTIDVWIRPNSVTGYKGIWQSGTSTTEQSYLLGNTVYWSVGGSTIISSSVTVNANEWTMLSYEREGNTHRIYKNGTLEDTATTANKQDNGLFSIGKNGFGDFNGYIDEFRVSDITRYGGSSFTEPTSAFSVDSDTIALLHFDGADGSTDMINALNAEALVLETNEGTVVADANTLVDLTGQIINSTIGTETVTADANVSVTGVSSTITLGNEGIIADANVSLTGLSSSLTLGTATLDANTLVDVTGQELTSAIGQVTAPDASAEVTGVSMQTSIGSVQITGWSQIDPGVTNVWTEVDKAA